MAENRKENFFPVELDFANVGGCLFTSLFVLGNIIFPWLVHTIPQGGLKFLPIYFFVLVSSYKFGWKVGILTAVLSPIANTILTGMPPAAMLPAILVKGAALVLAASAVSFGTKKLSILNLGLVVIGYQALGTFFDAAYSGSVQKALSDFALGWPGLLIQVFGGYAILKLLGTYRPLGKSAA
ncbi:MAG: ECF transporter S component [archaeon]